MQDIKIPNMIHPHTLLPIDSMSIHPPVVQWHYHHEYTSTSKLQSSHHSRSIHRIRSIFDRHGHQGTNIKLL